jgi:hypothetical protein
MLQLREYQQKLSSQKNKSCKYFANENFNIQKSEQIRENL